MTAFKERDMNGEPARPCEPWISKVLTLVLAVISFIVYYLTLSPSLSSQSDSGELVSAAALLGIAHPPGYPLYTLLGHLFCLLPLGDAAFRLNLMSAFFASLAGVLIFHLGLLIFENLTAALATALLCIFSRDFWRLSLSAEVFSLNMFFVALILYLFFRLRWAIHNGNDSPEGFFLLFFAAGLSCAHHHTIVLLGPPCLYLALKEKMYRPLGTPRMLIFSLLFFIGGLAPYIYLPLRAAAHPPVCWGDASSFQGFLGMVTRKGYGTFALGTLSGHSWTLSLGLRQSAEYLRSLALQFTPFIVPLGVAGAILMALRKRTLFYFFLYLFLVYGILFLCAARFPAGEGFMALLSRFYLPSHCAFAIFAGMAITASLEKLQKRPRRALSVLFITLSLLPLMLNYSYANRHDDYCARDYGRNLLRSVDDRAILFVLGDVPCGALLYCQKIEGTRPDVTPLFEGLLGSRWYREKIARENADFVFLLSTQEGLTQKQLIMSVMSHMRGRRSVYFNHPVEEPDIPVICDGLAWKASLQSLKDSPVEALLDGYYVYTGNYRTERLDYFSRELLGLYSLSYFCLATEQENREEKQKAMQSLENAVMMNPQNIIALQRLGILQIEEKLWERAEITFRDLEKKGGDAGVIYTNLAIIYAQRGEHEKAKEALRRAQHCRGIRK
jgi:hypothetical protein